PRLPGHSAAALLNLPYPTYGLNPSPLSPCLNPNALFSVFLCVLCALCVSSFSFVVKRRFFASETNNCKLSTDNYLHALVRAQNPPLRASPLDHRRQSPRPALPLGP